MVNPQAGADLRQAEVTVLGGHLNLDRAVPVARQWAGTFATIGLVIQADRRDDPADAVVHHMQPHGVVALIAVKRSSVPVASGRMLGPGGAGATVTTRCVA